MSGKPVTTGAVTANVYLADRNAAGLTAYATAVSTPGNKLYGHYLTAAQTQAQFAPTAAEAAAVKAWAKSSGLSVSTATTGFGAYVSVSGSAAAVAEAFNVTFGSYRVGKATYRAPEQAASLPASIASSVMTVTGLDSAKHLMKPSDTLPPPPQNYFVAPDCSTYYGELLATTVPGTSTSIPPVDGKAQPWTNCGYTPAQIRGAYHVSTSGETGKGVTVAVVDAYASPTMATDAAQYAQVTGDPGYQAGQYSEVLLGGTNGWTQTAPSACDASGWYGEESLDVESVHGQAPDANIVYVGAVSCYDTDLGNALAYIVNHHTASIVSDSWGEPADGSTMRTVYDNTFKAGAVEGIGFIYSSGDSGYEDPAYEDGQSDQIQVDYPTSSPWVTSVGGTSLAIGANNNYEFETDWGTVVDPLTTTSAGASAWTFDPTATTSNDIENYYDGSGGGGVSTLYTQPWYQKGVVRRSLATDVPEGSTSTPMRVEPDVAALADPSTGFLVGETLFGPNNNPEKFYLSRIGGTSLAAPTFAGIEADAQQAARHAIGFANPTIYGLDRLNGLLHTFNDVTNHDGVYEVRSNYTDPYNIVGPLRTYLRELGVNGTGASALTATRGYDDATGVGSPDHYVQSFKLLGLLTRR